jgi:hypothetical protein
MRTFIKKSEVLQVNSETPDPGRRPSTRAGLHLTRRYGIDPAIADLLASFAGFDAELAETIGAEPNGGAK